MMKKYLHLILLMGLSNFTYAQHISDFTSIAPASKNGTLQMPTETHGFHYIIEHGDPLTAGGTMPDNVDFTGYVPIAGSSTNGYLGINSELTSGGMTILDINFNATNKEWQVTASEKVDFSGVQGTSRNCSGHVTPWNTLVTSEEATSGDGNGDGYDDLGWNVEIDPVTRTIIDQPGGLIGGDKLWALGNFSHENIVVHSNRRTVYQGADSNPGYLYKFVANNPEDLSSGDLYTYRENIASSTGEWVKINNSTPAEQNSTHSQAGALGARSFNGIEDVEISPIDGRIYFAVKGESRVYRIDDPDPLNGLLCSLADTYVGGMSYDITHGIGTSSAAWGYGNDNLAFDDRGNLWVLQDGGDEYIWVVEKGHTQGAPKVKLFGISPSGSEPTGITFSPDFKYLFMSIQHPSSANSSTTQLDAFDNPVDFATDVAIVIGVNGTIGTTTLLPLELADFYARKNGDQVDLEWTTYTEEHTSHFVVQKSQNGDSWEGSEEIRAVGSSTTTKKYSSTDASPFLGINYYRLKMVDLDGSYQYSQIVSVKMVSKSLKIEVHPNPADDILSIYFPIKTAEQSFIQISDISGKVMYEHELDEIEAAQFPIDIRQFPKGLYLVSINSGGVKRVVKIVKR